MRSLIRCSLGALCLVAAFIAAMQFFVATDEAPERVLAGPGATLSLDMDTTDGVCTDIDSYVSAAWGMPVPVGVCLTQSGTSPVAAFQYRVLYNDSAVAVPEEADVTLALDDNPDANTGTTTSSVPNLGGGWTCDGGVGVYPKGDVDGVQDGDGTAFSGGCLSASGPWTLFSGPLGVIEMQPLIPNYLAELTFSEVSVTGEDLNEIGSCAPVVEVAMICNGGTLASYPDCDNPGYADDELRTNGPNVPGDDATWPRSENGPSTGCDLDDDNDLISDHIEDAAISCTPAVPTIRTDFDSDNDHLGDGWECQNGSNPRDPASKYLGPADTTDDDGDRVPNIWELRGYASDPNSTDSDADGCSDLVEIASVDSNRSIGDGDRLAVARRALNIWAPDPDQDWVLDINANGFVSDPDRLFVARAALLPDWQPKTCP